jgi:hypothetical protein
MTVQVKELLPTVGQLSVNINVSASINVTAFSARQKVTGFVADEISTHMHGGEPTLVMDKRIYWRVPVILSLPPKGDIGKVGEIDVDVETGQLSLSPTLISDIESHAEYLASRPTL